VDPATTSISPLSLHDALPICFGAAIALVLACDLRVAGDGASFASTPAKLGLGYPREDVARLIAQIGKGNAARMLFTGEIVDAGRSEEHTSELQSRSDLVCRLL